MHKDILISMIKSHGFTLEEFAGKIGINYTTLYRKLNGTSDFTRNEIMLIGKELSLPKTKIYEIFFTQ